MSSYILEIMLMQGNDWLSRGFHVGGFNTQYEPFEIGGQNRALKMSLDFAKSRLAIYRSLGNKCRILDVYGSVVLDFDDSPEKVQQTDVHSYIENAVWRETLPDGRTIELPIIVNRAYDPPRFYFKFAMETGLEPNRSIQGLSAKECFDRFTQDPHWTNLVDRYRVESLPEPVATVPPGTPLIQVSVPPGRILAGLGFRPGNTR